MGNVHGLSDGKGPCLYLRRLSDGKGPCLFSHGGYLIGIVHV